MASKSTRRENRLFSAYRRFFHHAPRGVQAAPIPFLLLAFIGGVILGDVYPGWGCWALCGAAITLVLILCLIQTHQNALFAPLLLFALIGYLALQYWTDPVLPRNHVTRFIQDHAWVVTGVVADDPIRQPHRIKLNLKVQTLAHNGRAHPVVGRLRVTLRPPHPVFSKGQRIRFKGKIRAIRNFNNPHGFDYERYMAHKDIRASSYAYRNSAVILNQPAPGELDARIGAMRQKVVRFIQIHAQGSARAVLKALLVGDRGEIQGPLRDAFRQVGVSHILAISGLHIGIIATVAFGVLRSLLRCIKPLLWRAWSDKVAALLTIAPVIFYGLLAGMSPSTQRAVVMVTLFLITLLGRDEHNPMNTLAWAALLILIASPPLLFSISFQLSFAAVFSILYGMGRLQSQWKAAKSAHPARRLMHRIMLFMLTSLLAVLGVAPLTMHYFNQIAFIGVFANLVVIPLIGFMAVPLGLTAVFWMPLCAWMAEFSLWASAMVLTAAIHIIFGLAAFPWTALKTFTPTLLEMVCYYGVFFAAISIIAARIDTPNEAGMQLKTAVKVLMACSIILSLDAVYWCHKRYWRDDLRVTMIDVGQGSSALIELPRGECMLVDGGGFSDASTFDVGAGIVAPLLWRKKIMTVETVVLTHPESDHLNGLVYILEHFHVKRVWRTDDTADTQGWTRFAAMAARKHLPMQSFGDLAREHVIEGVTFRILYPPGDYLDRPQHQKWRGDNNNSLVMKMTLGRTSFLFTGDILERAEEELIRVNGDELCATVMFAPHHGSRSSSTRALIDRVRPEIVLISCGFHNRFGFPHAQVLDRYRRHGSRMLRTDLNGAVEVVADGQSVRVKPYLPE